MQPTLIFCLFALCPLSAAVTAEPREPLPVSAHNCYPSDSHCRDRLNEALALGIDNVEIDLGWDEDSKKLLVGHDAKRRPGVTYPELEDYLVPALEAHWKRPRADGAPTVLTIDWKTSHPDAVRALKAFLDTHADWFSSAPKAADSPMTVRRLTVCFTGSDEAKAHYDSLVPDGGTYRAFRDKVFGAGEYQNDVKDYATTPASAYHRFLTFHWANIERGGPPLAGKWTDAEAARLKALVVHAHRQDYRVRFYCLNGRSRAAGIPYRFPDEDAARTRWLACAEVGADWVATDDYAEIVKTLRRE